MGEIRIRTGFCLLLEALKIFCVLRASISILPITIPVFVCG
jgi:hypothetical protein